MPGRPDRTSARRRGLGGGWLSVPGGRSRETRWPWTLVRPREGVKAVGRVGERHAGGIRRRRPAISRTMRPETADSMTTSRLARLVSGSVSQAKNEVDTKRHQNLASPFGGRRQRLRHRTRKNLHPPWQRSRGCSPCPLLAKPRNLPGGLVGDGSLALSSRRAPIVRCKGRQERRGR